MHSHIRTQYIFIYICNKEKYNQGKVDILPGTTVFWMKTIMKHYEEKRTKRKLFQIIKQCNTYFGYLMHPNQYKPFKVDNKGVK